MTAILLALGSSVAYGLTDFLGGLAARRAHIFLLGSVTQPLGLVVLLIIAPFVGGEITGEVWFWGVVSGLGGALAYVTLFRALAIGPMSVASPISAIIAVVLPVLAGVLFGERLPAVGWLGIAVGIVAVLMVSQVHEDAPHPVSLQVLLLSIAAGVFISVFLVALERAPADSGLWPIVIVRIVTSTLLLVAALASRVMARPPRDVLLLASASTLLDVLATVAFMLATREGLLTVVAVITALYPAATVLMARVVLKEHLQLIQRVGLLLAAMSVGVLAVVPNTAAAQGPVATGEGRRDIRSKHRCEPVLPDEPQSRGPAARDGRRRLVHDPRDSSRSTSVLRAMRSSRPKTVRQCLRLLQRSPKDERGHLNCSARCRDAGARRCRAHRQVARRHLALQTSPF